MVTAGLYRDTLSREICPNKGDEWRAGTQADRLFTVVDRVIYNGRYFSDISLVTSVLFLVSQGGCNPLPSFSVCFPNYSICNEMY